MLERFSPLGSTAPGLSATVSKTIWALLGLILLAGCHEDGVTVKPSTGVIEVTTLAEGSGPVPDSFTVVLDGRRSGTVLPNGVYPIPFLTRGDYEVSLLEEADNCWYGTNARTVTVQPNDTTFTTFLVRCR